MKSKFDGFYRARLKNGLHEITLPCPNGFAGARLIIQEPDEREGTAYQEFRTQVLDKEGEFTSNDFPGFEVHMCRIYLKRLECRGEIKMLPDKRPTKNGKKNRVYVYVVA